jgi:hypothetical protein
MIRNLISKFNRSLSERMVPARKQVAAPVRVWFAPEKETEINQEMAKSVGLSGETLDISQTGIAFLVSSIRIKEKYLVGQDRKLNVEVDLPAGKLSMQVVGRRYNKVGEHLSMEKYLIGAEIVQVNDGGGTFAQFLQKPGPRGGVRTGHLELG